MKKLLLFLLISAFALVVACGPAPRNAEPTTEESVVATTESGAEAPTDTVAETTTVIPTPLPEKPTEALLALLPNYDESKIVTTASGLQYIVYQEGSGDLAITGDTIQAHYTGYLSDGTKFDSSVDRGQTFDFPLGMAQVIPGWDEGFALLTPGSKALFIIPSALGYGPGGSGQIPPNATLYFDVELVGITLAERPTEVAEGDYSVTESGLKYYDLVAGDGATPQKSELAVIEYRFWNPQGVLQGSSAQRGEPAIFPVGIDWLPLAGLDEGVSTMKLGGKRQLLLTSSLAESLQLQEGEVAVFEVELVEIRPGAPEAPQTLSADQFTTLESGIKYADIEVGEGDLLTGTINMEYTAWVGDSFELLDSSLFSGKPIPYILGSAGIPGWDEGLAGMKTGGVRQLFVPAEIVGPLRNETAEAVTFEVKALELVVEEPIAP